MDLSQDKNKSDTKEERGSPKFASLKSQLANKQLHEKVDFILHRPVVEYVIIVFIIADALIITASLLLEINLIQAKAELVAAGKDLEGGHGNEGSTTGIAPDDDELEQIHKIELTLEILHFTSLAILSLFMVEVLLKLYGQRERFFKRKMQVVDAFVVAISFGLDIAIVILNNIDSTIISGLSLMILLRLWRMIRIVNSAVVATKAELEEKIHSSRGEAMRAREELHTLQEQLNEKEAEIEFLKTRLSKYEPIDMVPTGSTRLPPYLPETKKFPKKILGETTDDEDYQLSGFADLNHMGNSREPKATVLTSAGRSGTAFQAYQPGMMYQPTSQYPVDQLLSHSHSSSAYPLNPAPRYPPTNTSPVRHNAAATAAPPLTNSAPYHDNELLDTADESDVVSIKPSKSRSGNTFTVKKDGVPMTAL